MTAIKKRGRIVRNVCVIDRYDALADAFSPSCFLHGRKDFRYPVDTLNGRDYYFFNSKTFHFSTPILQTSNVYNYFKPCEVFL